MKNGGSRFLAITLSLLAFCIFLYLGCLILERIFNPRVVPSVESNLRELSDLYGAGQFAEVLNECDRAEHDPRYAAWQPQVLYIQWAAERKLGNADQGDRIKKAFLERYPRNTLAADMYFEDAMRLLTKGQDKAADEKLAMIEDHFPNASVGERCKEIREHLEISRQMN